MAKGQRPKGSKQFWKRAAPFLAGVVERKDFDLLPWKYDFWDQEQSYARAQILHYELAIRTLSGGLYVKIQDILLGETLGSEFLDKQSGNELKVMCWLNWAVGLKLKGYLDGIHFEGVNRLKHGRL